MVAGNVALRAIEMLVCEYRADDWWPSEGKYETMIGALLIQRTKWANVERAIDNVKSELEISPIALSRISIERLEKMIRPTGFYRQKARRIKALSNKISSLFGNDVQQLFSMGVERARGLLLSIDGIGHETADAMLLYAGNLPVFIVDGYARRLLTRLGAKEGHLDRNGLQAFFECAYGTNPTPYMDAHCAIVSHCQNMCRKVPDCKKCSLEALCEKGRTDAQLKK